MANPVRRKLGERRMCYQLSELGIRRHQASLVLELRAIDGNWLWDKDHFHMYLETTSALLLLSVGYSDQAQMQSLDQRAVEKLRK